MSCNCPDPTVCEQLEPVLTGTNIAVLDASNCPRALARVPGGLMYTDGTSVYFADGSTARPLSLPGMVLQYGMDGTDVPGLVFRGQGGVLGSLLPDPDTDGLYIQSLAGQWHIGPLPVVTSWPVGTIPEECCCPTGFLTVSLDEDEENLVLGRFNPCTDATTVTSGPILTCEEGCIRKLAGTSDDQVPVWDNTAQEWVPTEISDLIPTPDSVLDVAYFYVTQTGDETTLPTYGQAFSFYPHGTGGAWTISQSGSLISSALVALPYIPHNTIRVLNAGWHQVDFTVNGVIAVEDSSASLAETVVSAFVEAQHTGSAQPFEFYGSGDSASSGAAPNVLNRLLFSISGSYAKNFSANEDVDIVHALTFSEPGGGSVAFTTEPYTFTFRCQGTITRIT